MDTKEVIQNIDEYQQSVDVRSEIFRTRVFSLEELMAMLDSKKLKAVRGAVLPWTKAQQSRVIEALLQGHPPYTVMLDGSKEQWFIIDGTNDLEAYRAFFSGELKLEHVRYGSSVYSNRSFKELPFGLRNQLLNIRIIATVINPDTSPLTRLWIYDTQQLHAGVKSRLWSCAKQIFQHEYEQLKDCAAQLNLPEKDVQLFWRLVIALIYKDCFTGDSSMDDMTGRLRFNYLCCVVLTFFSQIENSVVSSHFVELPSVIQQIKSKTGADWSVKKKKCFSIIVMLDLLDGMTNLIEDSYVRRFNKAWKEVIKEEDCKGYLFRNYVACVSRIRKNLKK